MQLKLLIDGIVRQTTVLIARVSTGQGFRLPLGRVADQVFLDLARELEQQGVSKVRVADMFGMAQRSYHRKLQSSHESGFDNVRTLWESVYDFVRDGLVTRRQIKERFSRAGEREVVAVLCDLVRSGFVFVTGSGEASVYGASATRLRAIAQSSSETDALAHYAWFKVFVGEATSRAQLTTELGCDDARVDGLLRQLKNAGRVAEIDGRLTAVNFVIPVCSPEGAETALLDHFRAAATVLAGSVARGPDPSRLTGGSTFSFRLDSDHPEFNGVQQLLASTRERTQALWEHVMQHNASSPPGDSAVKITFYAGQSVVESPAVSCNRSGTC